jgi:GDP/UDP-N,N'-diacetylbacillosamine 2-epimerase (hydrolysing)
VKKVCVVTGSRADYGLLRWVIEGINNSSKLELQLVVTGMHLSPEFGLTWREIESDGFRIHKRVETLLSSDTPVGIAKSVGLGIVGFADAYSDLQPDLVLVLGDRYEIFAAVAAALPACIPIVHLHGGETTEGAIDEAMRHSITKMSHLHFVATGESRRRVLQLGESPEHIFLVGGLGVDSILRLPLLPKAELETVLDFKFAKRNLLVTFHPTTLEPGASSRQMSEILTALDRLLETNLIFTMPNSDTEGRALISMIDDFVRSHPNASAFDSLGQLRYLSCVNQVDGVVGNSSSGLLEVPSFKKGTIDIGDRQKGRERATSVIHCEPEMGEILNAFSLLYSSDFQATLAETQNPYGNGGASEVIVEQLEMMDLDGLLGKAFINFNDSSKPSM